MLFPVQQPGEDIAAEWELFFHFAFSFPQKNSIFSYQKNDGTYCGRPTGQETTFFKGGLRPTYRELFHILLFSDVKIGQGVRLA